MWLWYDDTTDSWKQIDESENIEEEYIQHLNGERIGQRVYYCFGPPMSSVISGSTSTCINFDKMKTYCGSGRCILTHQKQGLDDKHASYKLKRI
jgi:hypothetical protein